MSPVWIDDMPDGVTLAQLLAIREADVALAVKVEQHEHRQWGTIKLGAFDQLRAALNTVPDPAGLHDEDECALWLTDHSDAVCTCVPLLPFTVPELDSTAARLEELGRGIHPRAGDSSGGEVA